MQRRRSFLACLAAVVTLPLCGRRPLTRLADEHDGCSARAVLDYSIVDGFLYATATGDVLCEIGGRAVSRDEYLRYEAAMLPIWKSAAPCSAVEAGRQRRRQQAAWDREQAAVTRLLEAGSTVVRSDGRRVWVIA